MQGNLNVAIRGNDVEGFLLLALACGGGEYFRWLVLYFYRECLHSLVASSNKHICLSRRVMGLILMMSV